MVRKYEPHVQSDPYSDYPDAAMRESQYGRYVRLKTYQDETARLNALVERMKKQIVGLQQEILDNKQQND